MVNDVYPHDAQLYDRRFMNCAERHAVVFIKEQRAAVDTLFYRALVSSDAIFQQILQEKTPKYNFVSGCLGSEDLAAIGIQVNTLRSDRFADIKADVDGLLSDDGYVLISGSVFYFDHCPEFRNRHLHHLVVLRGYDAELGRYDVVDDNPASVLCEYSYPSQQVAEFYENNGDRLVRHFILDDYDDAKAYAYVEQQFRGLLQTHSDSQVFFHSLTDFLEQPFESQDRKLHLLHDAFSLLSGSRNLFAHYLETAGYPSELAGMARSLGQDAFILKSLVVKARVTKRVDIQALNERAQRMCLSETRLLVSVREAIEHRSNS